MTMTVTKAFERQHFLSNDQKQLEYNLLQGQSANPFCQRIPGQEVTVIPRFILECGTVLQNVPVAFKTWGNLSVERTNVLVICHALSGSADVSDWWGPLLGPGRAFDTDKYMVICMNSLGSPYGTASPVTAKNGNVTEGWYGPEFPPTSIRDDVNLHRLLLDSLRVREVAAVIGGSMGGMLALEWAFFGRDYVRSIVAIATASQQTAWAIGWGETQRQAICSDSKYQGGYYSFENSPVAGLEAARMAALLTYRSRDSFERRFGRKEVKTMNHDSPWIGRKENLFATQTYLRYQAKKFSERFDSNCYISLTEKLDTHDISRGRAETIEEALALIEQPVLIAGVRSDGLYTLADQEKIAQAVPNAKLKEIMSNDGHDAFLIESDQLNAMIKQFLVDSDKC